MVTENLADESMYVIIVKYLRVIVVVGAIIFLLVTFLRTVVFWEVILDNPTDSPISVLVDEKEYTVPAGEFQWISLGIGMHTVKLSGERVGDFKRGWMDAGSIINPTRYTYTITDMAYSVNDVFDYWSGTVELGWIQYEWIDNPRRVSSLYIKNIWDYGLGKRLPDTIEIKKDTVKKTKIFHEDEFKREYEEYIALETSDEMAEEKRIEN